MVKRFVSCVEPDTGRTYKVAIEAESDEEALAIAIGEGHTPDISGPTLDPQILGEPEEERDGARQVTLPKPPLNVRGVLSVLRVIFWIVVALAAFGLTWHFLRAGTPRQAP